MPRKRMILRIGTLILILFASLGAVYLSIPPTSPEDLSDLLPAQAAMATLPPTSPSATPTPTPEPDHSTPEIKIQMAGDILLHTGPVRAAKTEDGYDFFPYFSLIAPYLDGDLTLCNMESPVDAYGENDDLSSYPMFNVPYEILPALREAGFTCLLTANNHSYDKGYTGLTATRRNMEKAGIDFFGTYETAEQFDRPKILDIQGLKVGLLAYADAVNGLDELIPADMRPFTMRRFLSGSLESVPDMTADIQKLRAAGAQFVIVVLHWGAEYVDKPTQTQMDIAKALCDGGADVILGGHSHCVQPVEWHESPDGRKSLILYSLGNFFADQIAIAIPKTQYGMLVSLRVHLDKTGTLVWDGAELLPTLTYRYPDQAAPRGISYRLLPLDTYPGAPERPSIFANDGEWNKAKNAFAHVEDIAGEAVAVMGR